MVEMAFGLPYKHEDHTTAIQFIYAQLETFNLQAVFAQEQDRLEMIRVLHAARLESDNGKDLDMEILLNLIGGIFKPEDEAAGEYTSLQAALTVQVWRTNYETGAWQRRNERRLRRIRTKDPPSSQSQTSQSLCKWYSI